MSDDKFDPKYMAGKAQFEISAIIQQAAYGEITVEEAMDQVEDLTVCTIVEGLDDVLRYLYTTDANMLKHILAKTAEALQHRSEHLELYFENPDVEVKDE